MMTAIKQVKVSICNARSKTLESNIALACGIYSNRGYIPSLGIRTQPRISPDFLHLHGYSKFGLPCTLDFF